MDNRSYSKGISWIDDCRIPFVNETILLKGYEGDKWITGDDKKNRIIDKQNTQGRFPANILVSDDMLNDGGIKGGGKDRYYPPQYKDTSDVYGKYTVMPVIQYSDKGTNSRYYDIDKWFDNILDV